MTMDSNDAMMKVMEERLKIQEHLMSIDPTLNPLTALIMAGDVLSAQRADRFLDEGMPFEEAVVHTGSYTRLDFAVRAYERGRLALDDLLDKLPDLWRGSDPDDTDIRFAKLWVKAWQRNGKQPILDGPDLPKGHNGWITIYRGQDPDAAAGIAWTTREFIADKFAHGAATREHNRQGVIYKAKAKRKHILGYLTERKEYEVIILPVNVVPV